MDKDVLDWGGQEKQIAMKNAWSKCSSESKKRGSPITKKDALRLVSHFQGCYIKQQMLINAFVDKEKATRNKC